MLYDLTEIRALFGDDLNSLKELLENFVTDAELSVDRIDAACITGDASVVKAELHKFTGMVGTLNISSIREMLKSIEREINDSGLDDANLKNIRLITGTIREVIAQLKNETIV